MTDLLDLCCYMLACWFLGNLLGSITHDWLTGEQRPKQRKEEA